MSSGLSDAQRALLIESVFKDWDEYQAYYEEACRVNCDRKKRRALIGQIFRKYFEVEFKTALKAPRIHYPEDSESIVLQIPQRNNRTRAKGEIRLKFLAEYQHVVATTEMYMRDQMAIRMKLMNVKVKRRKPAKKKVTKKKTV